MITLQEMYGIFITKMGNYKIPGPYLTILALLSERTKYDSLEYICNWIKIILKKSCFLKSMLLPNFAFDVIYTGNKAGFDPPNAETILLLNEKTDAFTFQATTAGYKKN